MVQRPGWNFFGRSFSIAVRNNLPTAPSQTSLAACLPLPGNDIIPSAASMEQVIGDFQSNVLAVDTRRRVS
jgi:hypothetical protein